VKINFVAKQENHRTKKGGVAVTGKPRPFSGGALSTIFVNNCGKPDFEQN